MRSPRQTGMHTHPYSIESLSIIGVVNIMQLSFDISNMAGWFVFKSMMS